MAPHSSTLVWKVPWTEGPGRLQSMGSLRVRYNWASSLSPFTFMHWNRKWQPTPVFLPGESQGGESLVGCQPTPVFLPGESQGGESLVGCCLWGRTEPDTTERLDFHFSLSCVGEENGNPLQNSCLGNPVDRGAWWATIHGVRKSQT